MKGLWELNIYTLPNSLYSFAVWVDLSKYHEDSIIFVDPVCSRRIFFKRAIKIPVFIHPANDYTIQGTCLEKSRNLLSTKPTTSIMCISLRCLFVRFECHFIDCRRNESPKLLKVRRKILGTSMYCG